MILDTQSRFAKKYVNLFDILWQKYAKLLILMKNNYMVSDLA